MHEATAAIASHVEALTFDDLPRIVIERAKLAILDTLGVAVAGSRETAVELVLRQARTGVTRGDATVLGHPEKLPAAAAALVNGAAAHVLDFDDSGHSSAHLLPAVLAPAEARHVTGADLLLAFVAGREVRMRLNEEIDAGRFELRGRGPGSRGWHATGTLGSLGSAIAVGKLLGLDAEHLAMTLGLAASLGSGIISNFATMTKCLHVGNAARNGVLSAHLVADGFTADPHVLTSRKGFVDAMCLDDECDIDRVVERLTSGFHLEQEGNRIKPYPSCSGTHRYIEATRMLIAEHGLTAEDVANVTLTARPSLVCPSPANALEAKFSGPFAIAATLLDGAITLDNCTDDFLASAPVQRLLARTTELPQESPAWVRLETNDGRMLQQHVLPPPSLTDPEQIVAKFRACADPILGSDATDAVRATVMDLERLEDVARLTPFLVPATGAR